MDHVLGDIKLNNTSHSWWKEGQTKCSCGLKFSAGAKSNSRVKRNITKQHDTHLGVEADKITYASTPLVLVGLVASTRGKSKEVYVGNAYGHYPEHGKAAFNRYKHGWDAPWNRHYKWLVWTKFGNAWEISAFPTEEHAYLSAQLTLKNAEQGGKQVIYVESKRDIPKKGWAIPTPPIDEYIEALGKQARDSQKGSKASVLKKTRKLRTLAEMIVVETNHIEAEMFNLDI